MQTSEGLRSIIGIIHCLQRINLHFQDGQQTDGKNEQTYKYFGQGKAFLVHCLVRYLNWRINDTISTAVLTDSIPLSE